MKTKYDSSSIDTLRFPDNIRKSPAMYLGSTDEHGRWLIARELLDNGLDEALAARNNAVALIECKDGTYWVLDNGHGIPQGVKTFDVNVNGKVIKNKMPTMQAIFSELHTSGKFRGEAYKTSVGCFTGDTKIIVGGNKVTTFEELYNNWQPISTVTYDIKSDELPNAEVGLFFRDIEIINFDLYEFYGIGGMIVIGVCGLLLWVLLGSIFPRANENVLGSILGVIGFIVFCVLPLLLFLF